MDTECPDRGIPARLALLIASCGLTLAIVGHSALAAPAALNDPRQSASAALERCVQAPSGSERYATFAGRMVALPGSTEMAMRIDIQERGAGDDAFHRLERGGLSGLGAWRIAEPGVKVFKDLKQVTNLDAPVEYRALVRFRWSGPKGMPIKREVLRTAACRETLPGDQGSREAAIARMR